jgi:hypothetical protein
MLARSDFFKVLWVLFALHACQQPAYADMWIHVDKQGVKHFASSQLDKRYKLMFRGISMPDTMKPAERGVASDRGGSVAAKLADPRTNINTGARYLRDLINMFPGQLELAVAAYNAGEGAVQKAGNKIPAYRETQNYVRSVMSLYNRLSPPGQRLVASVQQAPTELSN